MLRKDTQQALRALSALARHDEPVAIGQLAKETNAPGPMLSKVLQRLAKQKLVLGRPGPGGGYRLARPAEEISLEEVVRTFEGPAFGTTCLMGHESCEVDCPLHATWETFMRDLKEFLKDKSVADFAEKGIFIPTSKLMDME